MLDLSEAEQRLRGRTATQMRWQEPRPTQEASWVLVAASAWGLDAGTSLVLGRHSTAEGLSLLRSV